MDRNPSEDVQPDDPDRVGTGREPGPGAQLAGRSGDDAERRSDARAGDAPDRGASDDPDAIPSGEL